MRDLTLANIIVIRYLREHRVYMTAVHFHFRISCISLIPRPFAGGGGTTIDACAWNSVRHRSG